MGVVNAGSRIFKGPSMKFDGSLCLILPQLQFKLQNKCAHPVVIEIEFGYAFKC